MKGLERGNDSTNHIGGDVMTANMMVQAIGKKVDIHVEKWFIPMIVMDVKVSYGTPRLLVKPVNGDGEAWVELSRVRMVDTKEIKVY